MADYKTPGVYVEEISTLPPSVAQVATAVPAFLGNTEKQPNDKQPRRITSLLEYREIFGGPSPKKYTLNATGDAKTEYSFSASANSDDTSEKYLMYYALKLYFSNGGGPCYVHSVGTYKAPAIDSGSYHAFIATINMIDEPTILVTPDAALSLSADDHYLLCGALIDACADKKDRFAVVDVPKTTSGYDVDVFRTKVSSNHLDYGAAYMPYLKSGIAFEYKEEDVIVNVQGKPAAPSEAKQYSTTLDEALVVKYSGVVNSEREPKVNVNFASGASPTIGISLNLQNVLTIEVVKKSGGDSSETTANEILSKWSNEQFPGWSLELKDTKGSEIINRTTTSQELEEASSPSPTKAYSIELNKALYITYNGENTKPKVIVKEGNEITISSSGGTLTITVGASAANKASDIVEKWKTATATGWSIDLNPGKGSSTIDLTTTTGKNLIETPPFKLSDLKRGKTADLSLYHSAIAYINTLPRVTVPPSAAIAGLYCQVDNDRGVWKAPANVAVSNVIGPDHFISDQEQDNLNVDPTSGKSINAIRSFTGRGTMVWGARTLDGNSNEWRYISVRRLFITIEESVQKASAFAVFEPNDVSTWLKVKAMIESYLYGLWQQGAMMGASPAEAYFVNVGLHKTMTEQDILEGRLIVHVGIAAVRPAEFIILRFQHKMQEA